MRVHYSASVIIWAVILFFPCAGNTGNPALNESGEKTLSSQTPIDCPLRKQGIHVDHMEPFGDTEKYIDFLERKDRRNWQKPAAVIKRIGLTGVERVADVGAGSGYFTFLFAAELPGGKVYAIDVKPEMLRHIHHRAMSNNITNIEIILAEYNDPKVPADSDIIFICDVLHHVDERSRWMKNLYAEMKPGARLIVVEFKEGPLPEGPPEQIKLSPTEIILELVSAGFTKLSEDSVLLPYQNIFLFTKSP